MKSIIDSVLAELMWKVRTEEEFYGPIRCGAELQ